ncbi:MAG: hypothetical protein JWN69_1216 [Alphaproteobacteria bacterium]|nr:hypothetical protein [Alphaproteobacteria bacterium]
MSGALPDPGGKLDAERQLALHYVPASRRRALGTLWNLDATLGTLLAGGSQPLVTQIKLAWWRDALEALDHGPPPAEPLLQAVARDLLANGVSGAALAAMTEGWEILLTAEAVRTEELDAYARARGGRLFACSAALLGHADDQEAGRAGEAWALADFARRSSAAEESERALGAARLRAERLFERRWPARLRPLGMLGALATRDAVRGRRSPLERHGAPARLLRMLRHRLTGK